ncbi:hypothetical protein MTO96_044540 [Rhipicephalus appendiculatus]
MQEDQCVGLLEFANVIYRAAPRVFSSLENIVAIFNAADDCLRGCDPGMRVTSACTFTGTNPECWASNRQRAWNYLLNGRGIELIQLAQKTLHFRTLNVHPQDLDEADDPQVSLPVLVDSAASIAASSASPWLFPSWHQDIRFYSCICYSLRITCVSFRYTARIL